MRDQILVTGGSGKTGSRIVSRLRQGGLEPRVAVRSPRAAGTVRFDWLDAATFDQALEGVRAVYLLAPPDATDSLEAMRPFLEKALDEGVEKFVLLSASILEEGGPMMGAVHAFLKSHAPQWTVLRPTWFMQNFSEQQHLLTIRDEDMIYSATGDGRVPFIDADDIAAVVVHALVTSDFPNGDLVLTGPKTLSYDDVAAILSETLGRKVTHRRISEKQLSERFQNQGMPAEYADVLAAMDTAISQGGEDRVTNEVQRVTGHIPTDFRKFASQNRQVWMRASS
jgi:ergot alkaloid biosynthesis protein